MFRQLTPLAWRAASRSSRVPWAAAAAASGSSTSSRRGFAAAAAATKAGESAEWKARKAELKEAVESAPFLSDEDRASYLKQLPTMTPEEFGKLQIEEISIVPDAELAKLKKPIDLPKPVYTADNELAAIAWQYASRFGEKRIDAVYKDLMTLVDGLRTPPAIAPAGEFAELKKSLSAELQTMKKDKGVAPEVPQSFQSWIAGLDTKPELVPTFLRPDPIVHPAKHLERLSSHSAPEHVVGQIAEILKPLKVDPVTVSFVTLVIKLKKFRGPVFTEMTEVFNQLTLHHRKQIPTTITSAVPLDAQAKKLVQLAVEDLVQDGWTAVITEKVDPSIVGGVVVAAGNRAFDLSALSRMNLLRESLSEHAHSLK